MIVVTTHVLDRDCACARCRINLRPALSAGRVNHAKLKRGDRIGLIVGPCSLPDSAYHITEHEFDSNKFCAPLVDSIP